MKPNTPAERLYNGIIKENPTFVLMLGMCPYTAIMNIRKSMVVGMGLTTTVILAASNLMISLLRNFIPDRGYACIYRSCCFETVGYSFFLQDLS